jgi:hypothetical protein
MDVGIQSMKQIIVCSLYDIGEVDWGVGIETEQVVLSIRLTRETLYTCKWDGRCVGERSWEFWGFLRRRLGSL